MNIAVFGRTSILIETARALKGAGHRVSIVGTAKPSDTDGSDLASFEACAAELGAGFFTGSFASAASLIEEAAPELGISMNWPLILGDVEIGFFRHGILNAHAGDLPRYRGNACPNWAILNGEARVGVCVHRMEPNKLDVGPIALRRYFDLDGDRDIGDVYHWLDEAIPQMFVQAANSIEAGTMDFVEQSDLMQASLRCFPRRPEDAEINWACDAESLLRVVRASTRPFHGAFTTLEGKELVRIWRAARGDIGYPYFAVPGQVIHVDSAGVTIACKSGCLVIHEATFEDGQNALPKIGASIRNRLK